MASSINLRGKMDITTTESDSEDVFDEAAAYVASGSFQASDSDRLFFYSRYKQATDGECSIPRPGLFDFQGRKKWEAWNGARGLTKAEARREYVERLTEIDHHWEQAGASANMGWVSVSRMMKEEEPAVDPSEMDVFDFVKENDLEKVKTLPLGEIEKRDSSLMTPLHWACDRGHLEIVRHLLGMSADVEARDGEEQTPLHYAASCGHESVVKLLLQYGADVNARDCDGLRPFDCAEDDAVKALFKQ